MPKYLVGAIVAIAVVTTSVGGYILWPSNVSAQEILEQSRERSANVVSYTAKTVGQEITSARTDDVVVLSKFNIHGELHVVGQSPTRGDYDEQITVKEYTYTRRSPDELWVRHKIPAPDISVDPVAFAFSSTGDSTLASLSDAGTIEENGRTLIKLTAETDMIKRAATIWPDSNQLNEGQRARLESPRKQFELGSQHIVFWIGEDDGLLYRIQVSESFPTVGELEEYHNEYTREYYDFNSTIIEAPDESEVIDAPESGEPPPSPTDK